MPADDDTTPDEASGPVPGPPRGRGPAAGEVRGDGLDERVSAAESLPLGERAEAYRALHDELAARLDASPGSP